MTESERDERSRLAAGPLAPLADSLAADLERLLVSPLEIPLEKAWVNFPRYTNTTSATIPIALSEAAAAGKLVPGEWLCLAAVGAGFAGAIQLVRWGPI